MRRAFRFIRDTGGNNLLEAAIVTPLLLILTFGIVDFASMFYVYLSLENGVSQATRFAITGADMDDPGNPGTPLSREAAIKEAMRENTPVIDIDAATFTYSHMTPGSSSWASGPGGPGDISKVTVEYSWRPLTPIVRPLLTDGQMTVRVESAMKNEPRWD